LQLQKTCTVGSDGKTVVNTKYVRILKVIDEVCLAILYISLEKPFSCTRYFTTSEHITVYKPILKQEVLIFSENIHYLPSD